jgi:dihydroorotate dehydrogenase (fumarate)
MGLSLKNPIIISSSGLTDSVEKIKELEANGAAAVVLKSLFEEEIILEMQETEHRMTGRPFLFPETIDFTEEELYEDSVRKYIRLIKEAKEAVQIPIIASINCVSSQKWMYLAKEIQDAGADGLELNLFFLPSDDDREQLDNLVITDAIIHQVKDIVTLPVSLKIGYYCSNLASYISRISEAGVQGIVLFNRSWMPDIDTEKLVVTSGPILSSPGDYNQTLRWVSLMSGKVKCDLAASTGIHTGDTIVKQLLAGAKAVEVASVIYQHGPRYIKTLLEDMKKWMADKDFESIEDFSGLLKHATTGNPAAWERVQFMKNFSQFVS